jgi:hypothetical protein
LAVILLLLVVWGGVGAWWYMNRPESRSTDSIGSFRQQLRVLERTGPTTVAPAYRMQTADLGVYGASRVPTMSGPGRALSHNPSAAAMRRRQAQKRRRDVVYGLLAAIGGSFVLGLLPGLSVMWWLALLMAAALAVYIVVLVQLAAATPQRARRLPRIDLARMERQAEREDNMRYFPAAQIRRPVHISEAHPAYLLRRSVTN